MYEAAQCIEGYKKNILTNFEMTAVDSFKALFSTTIISECISSFSDILK